MSNIIYGYVGKVKSQTNLSNSGVFSVNEVIDLLAEDKWALQQSPVTVSYLVVGGGGGGGEYSGRAGGGGGAGGYRNSYASETSGANSSTETPLSLFTTIDYTVTVGAGGAGAVNNHGTAGNDSVFATITSDGGGQGVRYGTGGAGGSGGGNSYAGGGSTASTPTANQGMAGGLGNNNGHSHAAGGGGGGASQVGTNGVHLSAYGRPGGNGLYSSITGSSVGRAGGGTGGGYNGSSGDGGSEGGGAYNGDPGTVNTGGGGGGNGGGSPGGGAGGKGVIILRWATAEASSVSTTGLTTGGIQTSGSDSYIVVTDGDGTLRFLK